MARMDLKSGLAEAFTGFAEGLGGRQAENRAAEAKQAYFNSMMDAKEQQAATLAASQEARDLATYQRGQAPAAVSEQAAAAGGLNYTPGSELPWTTVNTLLGAGSRERIAASPQRPPAPKPPPAFDTKGIQDKAYIQAYQAATGSVPGKGRTQIPLTAFDPQQKTAFNNAFSKFYNNAVNEYNRQYKGDVRTAGDYLMESTVPDPNWFLPDIGEKDTKQVISVNPALGGGTPAVAAPTGSDGQSLW